MSIHEFRTQLESGNEKNSLLTALYRLSRLGTLRDLVFAATEAGGWVYWTDASAGPAAELSAVSA
jgi:hypothetical protein